jgi:LDH2 family malate/lactate/ureidoglycolate dehydrogenase
MPRIPVDRLEAIAEALLAAAGAPADIAAEVAGNLADSNLKGVDSHGVMQLPWYLEEIAKGALKPDGRPGIERESATTALLRGGGGFGMFALGEATRLATAKAKASGLGAVALVDCGHTGRLGGFAERAAAEGLFVIIFGGGAHRVWRNVVPHGGAEPVMSTNPYAFALPGGRRGPVVMDFATSVVSDGKIAVHRAEGKPLPEGWVLDKHGQPTTDPEAFYDGGLHLPAGGYKGYGLGLIAELIGDALLQTPPEFNWMVIALDLSAFGSLQRYAEGADAYLDFVKGVRPAEGVAEVLLPGEPERRRAEVRARDGVPLPDKVWVQLKAAAAELGLDIAALAAAERAP